MTTSGIDKESRYVMFHRKKKKHDDGLKLNLEKFLRKFFRK